MSKRLKTMIGLAAAIIVLSLLIIGSSLWFVANRYDFFYRYSLLAHAEEVFPQAKPSLIYWSSTDSADLFVGSYGYTAILMAYRPDSYTPPDGVQRIDFLEENDLGQTFHEAVPRWREQLGDNVELPNGTPILPGTGPLYIWDGWQWWQVWVEFTAAYTDEDIALASREIGELIRRTRRD